MATVTVYEGSVQYVRWPVAVSDETGAAVDPRGTPPEVAFEPVRNAGALTWHAAEWVTDTSTNPDTYLARILFGDAPWILTAGVYTAWIRITDNPETPILSAGTLFVAVAQ